MRNLILVVTVLLSLLPSIKASAELDEAGVKVPYIEGELPANPFGEDIKVSNTCNIDATSIMFNVGLVITYNNYGGKGTAAKVDKEYVYQVSCNKVCQLPRS